VLVRKSHTPDESLAGRSAGLQLAFDERTRKAGYRLKDHAAVAGKEDKNKKGKSKSNEPLPAEPAS
jgi:hypothetical protein